MPTDPHWQAFRSRYTGKSKEQRNKALRAEMPGGGRLLDLLNLVHHTRRRGVTDPADFLELVEDHLQDIRDDMVEEIERRYRIGRHRATPSKS